MCIGNVIFQDLKTGTEVRLSTQVHQYKSLLDLHHYLDDDLVDKEKPIVMYHGRDVTKEVENLKEVDFISLDIWVSDKNLKDKSITLGAYLKINRGIK